MKLFILFVCEREGAGEGGRKGGRRRKGRRLQKWYYEFPRGSILNEVFKQKLNIPLNINEAGMSIFIPDIHQKITI